MSNLSVAHVFNSLEQDSCCHHYCLDLVVNEYHIALLRQAYGCVEDGVHPMWKPCTWSDINQGFTMQPVALNDSLLMRLDLKELGELWFKRTIVST